MSIPAAELALFDLNNTIGAVEVGVLCSVFLFGIVTSQTYTYFRRFPSDSIIIKLLVAVIWLLELGHTIATCHALYTITVTDFGNLLKLIKAPQSLDISIIFSAFVGSLVQAYFAYRVLKFSKQLYIPVICWGLSLFRCAGTLVTGIEALLGSSVVQFETQWMWLISTILSVGAVVDVTIAASLCYYLGKHKSNSFRKTVKTINRLMIWSIETGLVTSIAAVTMLICFQVMKNNFVWIAIFTLLAKLFSNSLLVTLNARRGNRSDQEISGTGSTFIDIIPSMNSTGGTASRDRKSHIPPHYPGIAIEMSRTTEVVRDDVPSPSVSEHKGTWEGGHAV